MLLICTCNKVNDISRKRREFYLSQDSAISQQQSHSRPHLLQEFSAFEEALATSRMSNPWATESRLRQDLVNKLRQRPDGIWAWKADPLLFNTPLRDPQDQDLIRRYWRSLANIDCPILEVRGAESNLVSDDTLERMHQTNKGLISVDIKGAGHIVPLDKPEELIQVITNFLNPPPSGH